MTRKSIVRSSIVAAAIAMSGSVLAMAATYAAEPGNHDELMYERTAPQDMLLGNGRVVAVDRVGSRVTLEYQPIPEIFLEGGTRIFQVEDPAWLTGLMPGDKIRFGIERESRSYLVTRIQNSN